MTAGTKRVTAGAVLAGIAAAGAGVGVNVTGPAKAEPVPTTAVPPADPVPPVGPRADPAVLPAAGVLPAIPVIDVTPPAAPPPVVGAPPVSVEMLPQPKTEKPATAAAPVPLPSIELPAPKPIELPKPPAPPSPLDVPKIDAPAIDLPKPGPVTIDVPKVEAPKIDAPKVDVPGIELPKPVDPVPAKIDVPKVAAPVIDVPKIDPVTPAGPKVELPKAAGPVIDVPKVEAPAIDLPKPDAGKIDLPAVPAVDAKAAEPVPIPQPTPVALPAAPAKSAEPAAVPPVPGAVYPLQPSEPRLNVNSAEPVQPGVTAVPTALSRPAPAAESTPPGDAPMPLTVRHLAVAAALGTAALSAPARSDDPAKDKEKVEYKPNSTAAAVTKDEVNALRQDLKLIRELLEGKTDRGISSDGLLQKVEKMEKTVAEFDRRLKKLEGGETRVAGSSPTADGTAAPAAVGRVRVVNLYPVEVRIVVNGRSYPLEPNEEKTLNVPAGTFRYQLLGGTGGEATKDVKAGETVTLWVQ
jgi:hypothetical protein